MNKELELKVVELKTTQIDPLKAYLFQVELGEMPKDHVGEYLHYLHDLCVERLGLKENFIIVPTFKGEREIKITEVNND